MTGDTRILVFAFSDVGCRCLEYLIGRGEKIIGCYTYAEPPGPGGWNIPMQVTPPPIPGSMV